MATERYPTLFGYIGLLSSRPLFEDAGLKVLNEMKETGTVKLYWVSAGDTDFAHDGAKVDFEIIRLCVP